MKELLIATWMFVFLSAFYMVVATGLVATILGL